MPTMGMNTSGQEIHEQEQAGERQIDHGGDGGRGDEVAHHFERTQVRGERAHRRRTLRHLHAQHALHDQGREFQVDACAGQIDEFAAQQTDDVIHDQHQRHAAGEDPERLDREVRHHAVVHVHREQRHGDAEQVDQQGRRQDVLEDRALVEDRAPEPVALLDVGHGRRAVVETETRTHEDRHAGIARLQRIALQHHLALRGVGEQKARFAGIGVPTVQDAGFVAAQEQDGRQQGRIDLLQRTAHHLGGKTGMRGGTREQRRGQASLGQRQAGRQRRARAGPAMDARQFDQAVEQRVGMKLVFAHALTQAETGSPRGSACGGPAVVGGGIGVRRKLLVLRHGCFRIAAGIRTRPRFGCKNRHPSSLASRRRFTLVMIGRTLPYESDNSMSEMLTCETSNDI
jgi:hypothetical protein